MIVQQIEVIWSCSSRLLRAQAVLSVCAPTQRAKRVWQMAKQDIVATESK